jgi:hypothetical protein
MTTYSTDGAFFIPTGLKKLSCMGLILLLQVGCVEVPSKVRNILGKPAETSSFQSNLTRDSHQASAKRVALVIGNGNYPAPYTLDNPLNDAKDVAQAFKKLGYDVIHAQDANKQEMESLLRRFKEKLKGTGLGLFYFAGHGAQYGKENFLLPVGSSFSSDVDIQRGSISLEKVLSVMENANISTKVIVLDACRNAPFNTNGLVEMAVQAQHSGGTFIAYSTKPGATAKDGDGKNSPYTKGLLNFIHQGLPIEVLFRKVRTAVKKATAGTQTPWEHTSLEGGNLCLAPCVEFRGNTASGLCQMKVGDGLYEGECQNGVPHGQGVIRYADGEYYQGNFSNGFRHGFGVQYLSDGFSVKAEWANGSPIPKKSN